MSHRPKEGGDGVHRSTVQQSQFDTGDLARVADPLAADHLCSAASQLGETVQWWRGREERGNSIQKTLSGVICTSGDHSGKEI